MWGVVPCTNGVLAEAETDVSKLKDHPLFEGMLVCHSLTLIDGELCGDPLDAKVKYILSSTLLYLLLRDRSISRYLDELHTITLLHILVTDVRKY